MKCIYYFTLLALDFVLESARYISKTGGIMYQSDINYSAS
jgi:hypothetical protein